MKLALMSSEMAGLGEAFWAHVEAGADGCWRWTAGGTGGYGTFRRGDGRPEYAYRLLWEAVHGEPIGRRRLARRCSRRWCIAPLHQVEVGSGYQRPSIVIGAVALIPLSRGYVAMIDAADLSLVAGKLWKYERAACNQTGYAVTKENHNGRRQRIWMHRLICPVPTSLHVDHKNGSGLDNRRQNLRPATHQQNSQNGSSRKGSTSRFRGVSWHRSVNAWAARIRAVGELQHLGFFRDEIEAAHEYDHAALATFGEFARPNFPDARERNRGGSGRLEKIYKTHCPAGHAYEGRNVKVYNGCRQCVECSRIAGRRYRRQRGMRPQKLTRERAAEIRAEYEKQGRRNQRALAERFGISPSMVSRVVTGSSWSQS